MPATSYAVAKNALQESYDPSWVTGLYDKLRNPHADIRFVLAEAVKEDRPDKPLPIELVLDVLSSLEPLRARQVISVAKELAIWNDAEEQWLLFEQAMAEARIG